jgi:hypothetical protein
MRKIGAWSSGDTIKIDIEQRRELCVNFRQDLARYCLNEIKKALLAIDPTDLVDEDRPLGLQALGQIDVGRPISEPPCDWTYDRTAGRFMVASRCQDERRPSA